MISAYCFGVTGAKGKKMDTTTRKTLDFGGRTLSLETGHMAKQANGSVIIRFNDTMLLVTACVSKKPREGIDFFPLIVDFQEKMYASGKVPGGFFKRETRPSADATLSARLIDRSIRPLFPEGFRNEVQVVLTALSFDESCDLGALGVLGASAALSISDIPFHGPIAGASVGRLNDEFILFPTFDELDASSVDLSVAGSMKSIVMIESGAKQVSEQVMKDAVFFGHEAIQKMVAMQNELIAEIGKPKREFDTDVVPEDMLKSMEERFMGQIVDAVRTRGKHAQEDAIDALKVSILETLKGEMSEEDYAASERNLGRAYDELIYRRVRHAILFDHERPDGRDLDQIRPITCEIDLLPRVHGSALFTRGETQSLGAITLGSTSGEQIIDGMAEEYKKSFYLHYNFPPFSVGEVGMLRAPGRRELGHGALAERSLQAVIPPKEAFPYTIRAVSEILESNGSSSMASVCSCTLAMMAAGVPLLHPVAGVANGLIMEGDQFVVLTDIQGMEDHLGDMDFKVAGTAEGITAMQMDIKIEGITPEIMSIALQKALMARTEILGKMASCIAEPRADISELAPRIMSFTIEPNKIGEVIGPSGKMIKSIIEATKVEINIEDDGVVTIASNNREAMQQARNIINNIVSEPVLGAIYEGRVCRIESFGAFVKIMEGFKEGMVHISNMDTVRVRAVEDLVKLGDIVKVRYIGSEKGKIALAMKGIEGNPRAPRPEPGQEGEEQREPREYNRDHSHGPRPHGPSRDRFRRN
jgi:polyribonucleotide nucleotidyltransferase